MKNGFVRTLGILIFACTLAVQPATVSASENTGEETQQEEKQEALADNVEGAGNTGDTGNAGNTDDTGDAKDDTDIEEGMEETKTGVWVKSSGRWWYRFSDNTYPAGEIMTIDGKNYAFDAKGWMVTGWYKSGEDWYYFGPSGAMTTGWVKSKGLWYYLKPQDGIMIADSKEVIENKTYAFNKSGAMRTGWYKEGTDWYYFKTSGAMSAGWVKSKGSWYYLKPEDGVMAVDGMEDIDGKTYLFNKSGAMLIGWQKQEDTWYYFENSGAMKKGWIYLKSKWYYLDPEDGSMYADSLHVIKDKTYGFDASGAMLVGVCPTKVKLEDPDTGIVHMVTRTYYFDKNGEMQTGWKKIDGKWSYFDPATGIRYEGEVYQINGTNYAFDDNGVMVTGWYKRMKPVRDEETGKVYYVTDKYYFNAQGEPQTGWLTEGTDHYWINKDGWAVANGEYPVDKDRTALFDEDAKFVKFVEKSS